MSVETHRLSIHGHEMAYRELAPPDGTAAETVVLMHGIAGSAQTWVPVLERLAREPVRRRYIAPDFLGHGDSATPRGDYSLGAFANGVRDLLAALGHPYATIVGHSLGGGVAMQFAYQFPQLCERLVLVSSGGLGRRVSRLLRSAVLPGAAWVLPLLANNLSVAVLKMLEDRLETMGTPKSAAQRESLLHFGSLADPFRRKAFLHTARSVLDFGGQRITAADRLYLARDIPTLLVWGEHDPVIPVRHARRTAELMPGSELVVFEECGHFPHAEQPDRFAATLRHFMDNTEPARLDVKDIAGQIAEAARTGRESGRESGIVTTDVRRPAGNLRPGWLGH